LLPVKDVVDGMMNNLCGDSTESREYWEEKAVDRYGRLRDEFPRMGPFGIGHEVR
jgi:hypothetical protein